MTIFIPKKKLVWLFQSDLYIGKTPKQTKALIGALALLWSDSVTQLTGKSQGFGRRIALPQS